MKSHDLKNHLNLAFLKRIEKNPQYSLRAFGRDLNLDPTLLSRLMKGQRPFSAKMTKRISTELNWPLAKMLQLNQLDLQKSKPVPQQKYLLANEFAPISRWYFYVILELFQMRDFKSSVKWVANRLRLSEAETRAALIVLEQQGHIDLSKKPWVVNTTSSNWTNFTVTNRDKQNYQKQILDKAKEAIDSIDFSARDNSSLTIAMSAKLIPEVKKRIETFKEELRVLINEQGEEDEVYQFAFACFQLTQKGSAK